MHEQSYIQAVTLFVLAALQSCYGQIDRSAYTCQADSFQAYGSHGERYDCAKAIDGNDTTFWHSEWYPHSVPLPHTFTIDMGKVYNITSMSYLPRQDGLKIGNIGRWKIALSADHEDWHHRFFGTWLDDDQLKTFAFPKPILARWLMLVAYTEAGDRNNRTGAAEITIFDTAPSVLSAKPAPNTSTQPSHKQDSKDENPLGAVGTAFTVLGGLAAVGTLIWSVMRFCVWGRRNRER
ncbi:MAG: hypothetical protein L6R40_005437 [Gallowayella cf. fulva]|nr:MAG: hypothetical protein L6R40_005437 [Xanthomendoza cf. fulva]